MQNYREKRAHYEMRLCAHALRLASAARSRAEFPLRRFIRERVTML
jgi:hypothetical protein